MKETELPIIVAIKCLTYNHELYIRQCLEGFVMQQTNFRFVAIVHDDASTDKTAEIIREYAEKYPDVIIPLYETENQHSKHDGSLSNIINQALNATSCKYIAWCEGDDYWIDPLKLQKQVDFLETHPDYTMCCSDAVIKSPRGELNFSRYSSSTTIPFSALVLGGGLFIQTATLVYHRSLVTDYPDCCKQCHVGDYPMQIYAGLKGKVYYFAEKMAVYRFQTATSWTARESTNHIEKRIKGWVSEINMLNGLDILSSRRYTQIFQKRIAKYAYRNISHNYIYYRLISADFSSLNIQYTLKQRFKLFLMRLGIYPFSRWMKRH